MTQSMTILDFKPNAQGVCKARFSVKLGNLGITIRNCAYFDTGDRRWIGVPCKEYEKEGQKKYYPLVVFEGDVKKVFEEKVMALVKPMLGEPVHAQEPEAPLPDWVL